jgi:hypothetical protein
MWQEKKEVLAYDIIFRCSIKITTGKQLTRRISSQTTVACFYSIGERHHHEKYQFQTWLGKKEVVTNLDKSLEVRRWTSESVESCEQKSLSTIVEKKFEKVALVDLPQTEVTKWLKKPAEGKSARINHPMIPRGGILISSRSSDNSDRTVDVQIHYPCHAST